MYSVWEGILQLKMYLSDAGLSLKESKLLPFNPLRARNALRQHFRVILYTLESAF